jgi:hypothetical protein
VKCANDHTNSSTATTDHIFTDSERIGMGRNALKLSINRPTKRGKEKSPSNGHCQCEKEMEDHLLACQ